jgi:hypothetical protein
MEPTDEERRMTWHLCKKAIRSQRCRCEARGDTCTPWHQAAREAIRIGAKLPDLRMEVGERLFTGLREKLGWKTCWVLQSDEQKEAYAAAAEASRNAP